MKAAIYILNKKGKTHLENLILKSNRYCQSSGKDYDLFIEQVEHQNNNRKELDRLLQRVRKNEYDMIVVEKITNLGKSVIHLGQVIKEIERKDIEIILLNLEISTKFESGKRILQVLDEVYALETSFIDERVRKSIETKKRMGIRLGRPVGAKDSRPRKKSGYFKRYEEDKNKKTFVKIKEE